MEQDILLWCVAMPAITSLAFVLLARVTARIRNLRIQQCVTASLASAGWCVAVFVALVGRQNLVWHSLEAWQQVIVPISITSLLLALLSTSTVIIRRNRVSLPSPRSGARRASFFRCTDLHELRGIVAGLGCIVTAMMAMPNGEGWADMLPQHRTWMAAVAGASLINLGMLEFLVRRGAGAWVLWIALAGLGGPTMLAASDYAGLAEWLVSAVVATLVLAIATVFWRDSMLECSLSAIVLFAASGTASGRFYTYEDHSNWLYGLILLSPTCIAISDLVVGRRSTLTRVSLAALFAVAVLAIIGWFIFRDEIFASAAGEGG